MEKQDQDLSQKQERQEQEPQKYEADEAFTQGGL